MYKTQNLELPHIFQLAARKILTNKANINKIALIKIINEAAIKERKKCHNFK